MSTIVVICFTNVKLLQNNANLFNNTINYFQKYNCLFIGKYRYSFTV